MLSVGFAPFAFSLPLAFCFSTRSSGPSFSTLPVTWAAGAAACGGPDRVRGAPEGRSRFGGLASSRRCSSPTFLSAAASTPGMAAAAWSGASLLTVPMAALGSWPETSGGSSCFSSGAAPPPPPPQLPLPSSFSAAGSGGAQPPPSFSSDASGAGGLDFPGLSACSAAGLTAACATDGAPPGPVAALGPVALLPPTTPLGVAAPGPLSFGTALWGAEASWSLFVESATRRAAGEGLASSAEVRSVCAPAGGVADDAVPMAAPESDAAAGDPAAPGRGLASCSCCSLRSSS